MRKVIKRTSSDAPSISLGAARFSTSTASYSELSREGGIFSFDIDIVPGIVAFAIERLLIDASHAVKVQGRVVCRGNVRS